MPLFFQYWITFLRQYYLYRIVGFPLEHVLEHWLHSLHFSQWWHEGLKQLRDSTFSPVKIKTNVIIFF